MTATTGDLNDFTSALAAADLKWSHDLGDEQSAPAFIQFLASTVWSLWIQPRLAGTQPEPVVDKDALREHAEDLWSSLDWTLWGHGLGDVLRERMADTMLAALPTADLDQALQLMRAWKDRRGYPVMHEQFANLRAELSAVRATCTTVAREFDNLHSRYTVGPSNALRVVDLLLGDISKASVELRKAAETANGVRSASRPAIPADAVVLPENWRQQLGWLFTVEDAGKWTRICRLVEMWQGKRLGTDDDSNPAVELQASSTLLQNLEQAPSIPVDAVKQIAEAWLGDNKHMFSLPHEGPAGRVLTLVREWLAPAVGSEACPVPGVIDGDVVRDLLAEMAPSEWTDDAAGAYAEKVLAEMHRVGVTVLRGPKSEPWTPPTIPAAVIAGVLLHEGRDNAVHSGIAEGCPLCVSMTAPAVDSDITAETHDA